MKRFMILIIILACILTSCSRPVYNFSELTMPTTQEISTTSDKIIQQLDGDDEIMNKNLILKIGNKEVEVNWNSNDSINDLKKIAKDGLTVEMHKYGGFEQVGSIGKTITSNDTQITTSPGDIVLYSSNQIVIFYGSNTWAYTKLGHINLSKNELEELLGNNDVTITFILK